MSGVAAHSLARSLVNLYIGGIGRTSKIGSIIELISFLLIAKLEFTCESHSILKCTIVAHIRNRPDSVENNIQGVTLYRTVTHIYYLRYPSIYT